MIALMKRICRGTGIFLRVVPADELATFNDVSSGYTPEDDEEIVYWHRGE